MLLTNNSRMRGWEDLMKAQLAIAVAFLAFVPVSANAFSQQDQQACMNDAFTICGHAIPDQSRVTACMIQNYSRVSAPCRAVMARYGKNNHQQARTQISERN
jgi:hypothetical protein